MKKARLFGSKRAFTLVELIVVIAVIAVLSTIATLSVFAVRSSSEKKGAAATIKANWKITSDYLFQVNSGFTSTKKPSTTQLQTRTGDIVVTIAEAAPKALAKGKIYIQYAVNPDDLSGKYSIAKMYYRYEDHYYYSTNGDNVIGPNDTI